MIHSRAVIDSYGPTPFRPRWSRTTARPMRTLARGLSGLKRSRSTGVVNGRLRPWMKNATLDGSHWMPSGMPSSSYRPLMCTSLVNRWW